MIKILNFCSNSVNGGTAKIFYDVSMGLTEKYGNDLDVVSCVNSNNGVEIYNKIPKIDRLNVQSIEQIFDTSSDDNSIANRIQRVYRTQKYKKIRNRNIAEMREYIREKKVDAVLVHNGGYFGDDLCNQMIEAAYLEKIHKRIIVFHNATEKNFIKKLYYIPYDLKMNNFATKIYSVSNFTANRIMKSSLIKDVKVIYNGMKIKKTLTKDFRCEQLCIYDDKLIIGCIANFMHNKGVLYLIKAIANLNTNKNFRVIIIGNIYDKEYYETCVKYIKNHNLESIISIFHGIYNAGEYSDLFDIMVVPSIVNESFGLVSLEAMANKTPLVTFNCEGIPEVVGDAARVVEKKDYISLGNEIRNLLENENLRENLSKQAYKRYISSFTISNMIDNYSKLFL